MPVIGRSVHELRVNDGKKTWRIVYRTDADAIVIVHVFMKQSRRTPQTVVQVCKRRLEMYDTIQG